MNVLADSCIYTNKCDYHYRIDNVNSSVKDELKYRCIIDEFDFLYKELEKHQKLNKYIGKISEKKIDAYFWNYDRLSSIGRKKFLEDIHEDINVDIQNLIKENVELPKHSQDRLFYLSNIEHEDKHNKNEENKLSNLTTIIKILQKNQKCVCVSAGKYAESFVNLQNIYGRNVVEAVCDNNKDLIGKKLGNYEIESVEKSVEKYKDSLFVICNVHHGEQIKEQLKSLGVSEANILIINRLPGFEFIVNYVNNIPKITIIMPSLNVGAFIEKCINSVLKQTLKDIEILCIDAGSTDGTLEILEDYAKKDNRIKIINSEVKSYGYQLNLGISNARGEYIGIVETDDIIEPDMFEALYDMTSSNKPDYVKGMAVEFREIEGVLLKDREICPYDELKGSVDYFKEVNPSLDAGIFISDNFVWNGIYRSDFIKDIYFQETAGAAFQDISVLFQIISSAKKAIYINKVVYLYRQDNNAASSYNKKSIVYADVEYTRIIESFLDGVTDDWVKIFYKKLAYLLLNRFDFMSMSKTFWTESESGIEGIKEKLYYAKDNDILSEADFTDILWKKLKLFVVNPRKLFELGVEYYDSVYSRIDNMKKAIGLNEFIIVGYGERGKYLAAKLLLNYNIQPIAFWDNSSSKWGQVENNIPCEKPREIENKEVVYLIANKNYYRELRKQLLDLNISENKIFEFNLDNLKFNI